MTATKVLTLTALVLVLLMGMLTSVSSPAQVGAKYTNIEQAVCQQESPESIWQVGSTVYARIKEAPPELRTQPSLTTGNSIANRKLNNANTYVSARHSYLDISHHVWIKVLDSEWAQILPENNRLNPGVFDSSSEVFIQLHYLEPISVQVDDSITLTGVPHYDKLIVVVVNNGRPSLYVYEGETLVMSFPVILGATPFGDHKIYLKRIRDDMPGIPGVPFAMYFEGANAAHGAPWWSWNHVREGHLGSHGCVNLPDNEWYLLDVNGEQLSVDQWLWMWTNTGLHLSADNTLWDQAFIGSDEPCWYQPCSSTRFIVINQIEELRSYPLTNRLGPNVSAASVTDWQPLIDEYYNNSLNWVLPSIDGTEVTWHRPPNNKSVAEMNGQENDDLWVMVDCRDANNWNEPAAPGASRSKGELCRHFIQDRPGSVCTPERVDPEYFGQRIYCIQERFEAAPIELMGPLVEHELIHARQFASPKVLELYQQGIGTDDLSVGQIDLYQQSIGAQVELGASLANQGTRLSGFYKFVYIDPQATGTARVTSGASAEQTLQFLIRIYGGNANDPAVREQVIAAINLEVAAYDDFVSRTGYHIYELVVDYTRN